MSCVKSETEMWRRNKPLAGRRNHRAVVQRPGCGQGTRICAGGGGIRVGRCVGSNAPHICDGVIGAEVAWNLAPVWRAEDIDRSMRSSAARLLRRSRPLRSSRCRSCCRRCATVRSCWGTTGPRPHIHV